MRHVAKVAFPLATGMGRNKVRYFTLKYISKRQEPIGGDGRQAKFNAAPDVSRQISKSGEGRSRLRFR